MFQTLAEIRMQIRKCEDFIAVCDRIKQLEKLSEDSGQTKKAKLQSHIADTAGQLQISEREHQKYQDDLNSGRHIGAFELEQINGVIKTVQVRIRTLQASLNQMYAEIQRIDDEVAACLAELDELYPKLEHGISNDGLNPDTAVQLLADLRIQKEQVAAALKKEVSTRSQNDSNAEPQQSRSSPAEGVPVQANVFYNELLLDLQRAEKKVEVVAPNLCGPHTDLIMSTLARLAASGKNVVLHTKPTAEQDRNLQQSCRKLATEAHRCRITVIQRSGLDYNAVMIDNFVCWEGNVQILGFSSPGATMRRTSSSMHVRKLRHYLFNEMV